MGVARSVARVTAESVGIVAVVVATVLAVVGGAAWLLTRGGMDLDDPPAAAASSQYEHEYGVHVTGLSLGVQWGDCALVQLEADPLPSEVAVPHAIVRGDAEGHWTVVRVARDGAYFDSDDIGDRDGCLEAARGEGLY